MPHVREEKQPKMVFWIKEESKWRKIRLKIEKKTIDNIR